MASFSRSAFIPQSIVLNPECRTNPVVQQMKSINNDMRKIDAYVVLGLEGKRKLLEEQRKEDLLNQRRAKQAEQFQKTKGNPINFIKERLPRTGFLDTIRNYILYTFMGMAAPMVLKNLPTILNTIKYLVPVAGFLGKFFSGVLLGVVNAVDFGYRVHDKIRSVLKNVTGSKFEKQFDELEKNLNTFLNLAIIAGLAVAGSGAIPKPQMIGKRAGKIGGVRLPADLTKKSYERLKDSYERFSGGTSNIGDRLRLARRGIIEAEEVTTKVAKPVAKFAGKFGKVFGKVPIIGPLIDFTISVLMGETPGRAAARAVGSSVGFALGAAIPVLGQMGLGEVIGGMIGDVVGGALYDALASFGKPKAHATGGQVGAKSYSRTPRTIRKAKIKKPPKLTPVPSRPGKNIGGKEAIVKIFPESEDPSMMSPLTMLTKNAAIMKRAGVFGSLMGAGLDMMALGQKVEKSTLRGLEKYLGYVIQSAIDNQSQENAKAIGASMYAMATGGVVPSSRTLGGSGMSTGEAVAKEMMRSFTAMLDSRSTEIFQNIRRQLDLKPKEQPAGPGGPAMGDNSPAGQVFNALLAEGFTPEQAAGVVGNLMQESGGGTVNLVPRAHNDIDGGHTGIAQWSSDRWPKVSAYIKSIKKDPNSLDGQIAGLIWELKNSQIEAYQELKKAKTVQEAAIAFRDKFEIPGAKDPAANKRIEYAAQILQQFSSGVLTSANLGGFDDPIGMGKKLLSMGFNVGENRYFINNATAGSKFVPTGDAPVGSHYGYMHGDYALDVTDWRGKKSEGIERLKVLFKQLYSQRKQLGITELIFNPIGSWFEGNGSYTPGAYDKDHWDHLHIRFKKSSSSVISRYLQNNPTQPRNSLNPTASTGSSSTKPKNQPKPPKYNPEGGNASIIIPGENRLAQITNTIKMAGAPKPPRDIIYAIQPVLT